MIYQVHIEGEAYTLDYFSLRLAQLEASKLRNEGKKIRLIECYPSGKEVDITASVMGEVE